MKLSKSQEQRFEKLKISESGVTLADLLVNYRRDWKKELGIIKQHLSDELRLQKKEYLERIEGKKEIHTHNSISTYIDSVDNGCVICVRNQTLDDIKSIFKE